MRPPVKILGSECANVPRFLDSVLGHPVAGSSWEGFVIEHAPTVGKGLYLAAEDLKASRKIVVALVAQPYPMKEGIKVMGSLEATRLLAFHAQSSWM